jgi:hypothetical protein
MGHMQLSRPPPRSLVARQLTLRNLMRLPGQRRSLVCATKRPEHLQQSARLLDQLVGNCERRSGIHEGGARDGCLNRNLVLGDYVRSERAMTRSLL